MGAGRGAFVSETSLYFVYVLRNAAGIFYTGIAKDVDLRLRQHNDGRGARFTRGRGPWSVCHREGPLGHGDALRREAAIKIDRTFKAALRARLAALARKRLTRKSAAKSARSRANAARSLETRGPGSTGP